MEASVNWGSFLWGPSRKGSTILGPCQVNAGFWKLPNETLASAPGRSAMLESL